MQGGLETYGSQSNDAQMFLHMHTYMSIGPRREALEKKEEEEAGAQLKVVNND